MRFVKTLESIRGLPYGYKEVEYLQGTGTQYIMSGLSMPNGFRIKGSLSIDNLSVTGGIFGCHNSSSPYYRNFLDYSSAKNWLIGYGGGAYQYFGSNAVNTLYNLDVCNVHGKEHLEINGTEYTFSPTGSTGNFSTFEMPIFALSVSGTVSNIAKMKLYWLKIYNENDVLIRDYIPCLDPTNTPCFYDLVGKKPYYNQGTGTFTVGRQIIPVEYLESTGTQYIDTGVKINTTKSLYETKIVPLSSSVSQGLYGARNTPDASDTSNAVSFIVANQGFRFDWATGNGSPPYTSLTVGSPYTIKITGNRVEINDTVKTYTEAISTNVLYNFLIGTFTNGSSSPFPQGFIGRTFYSKLYNNGTLVRDFIPCKDENNVGFMFDTVSHTCYLNAGTGAFTVGENVYNPKLRLVRDSKLNPQYTEVEYLQSTGGQYIDTGFKPNNNTTIECITSFTNSFNIAACRWSGSPTYDTYGFFKSISSQINKPIVGYYGRYSDDKISYAYNYVNNTKVKMTISPTTFSVKSVDNSSYNVQQTITQSTYQAPYNLWIFENNYMGSPIGGSTGICKMYDFKLWDNGVLVRDMIPVLDNNNVPCMYDKVNGQFFYNKGSGSFSYGRKIIPVEYLESTGTQYIDIGVNVSNTIKWDLDASYNTPTGSSGYLNGASRVEGNNQQRLMMGVNSANYYSMSFVENNTTTIQNDNKRHIFEIDALNKTYSIDGKQKGVFASSFTLTPLSIYLFARHINDGYDGFVYGKIYGSKIYDNNVLIQDLIPVKDENGVGYMYDKITHTLFANSGSGSFTCGNEVRGKTRFFDNTLDGYEIGEYIESTGTQYIDTGILPKVNTTSVKLVFALTELATSAIGIFGSRTSTDPTTGTAYNIFSGTTEGRDRIRNDWSYGCTTRPYSSNNYPLTNTITANTKIMVQLNADSSAQIADGSFSTSSVTKYDCNYSMLIGSINTSGTVFASKPKAKWYYCQIWDNGVLVRNMLPAKRKSDNAIGMLDVVNKVFYNNLGSGAFTFQPKG